MVNRPICIAIAGGGFSGTMSAIHLARLSAPGLLRVVLINPEPNWGRGVAYRFEDDNLLLNVPAGNMSAFADNRHDFVAYCQSVDPAISGASFVSRRMYGQYMEHTLQEALQHNHGPIETVVDEVLDAQLETGGGSWAITLSSGRRLQAQHLVLATGNQAPKLPAALPNDLRGHVLEPWDLDRLQQLSPHLPVMTLGTGLTAVDALFTLNRLKPLRKVIMVSRHGLLPQSHRQAPLPPQLQGLPGAMLQKYPTTRQLLRTLRHCMQEQRSKGVDWRDVFNELRPHSPAIWQSLPAAEQARFMRHLQTYWDIHRHRLAPVAAMRLESLQSRQVVQVLAGRVVGLNTASEGVQVQLRCRGAQQLDQFQVSALINCTSPNTDLHHQAGGLLHRLMKAGWIQPDPHGLGLLLNQHYQALGSNKQATPGLWYVGPLLKSRDWEATAVPELRMHTQRLAQQLYRQIIRSRQEVVS